MFQLSRQNVNLKRKMAEKKKKKKPARQTLRHFTNDLVNIPVYMQGKNMKASRRLF